MATRTFKEKKQQSRVFFDVTFDVHAHVDIRERARTSETKDTNFVMAEKQKFHSGGHSCGGEKMRNASGQRGENKRQGRVKTNRNTSNKEVSRFNRVIQHCSRENKCTEKCAARAIFFFFFLAN